MNTMVIASCIALSRAVNGQSGKWKLKRQERGSHGVAKVTLLRLLARLFDAFSKHPTSRAVRIGKCRM